VSRARTRILYLTDYAADTGGAERFTLGLATHLPQDRFEPWVCSTRMTLPSAAAILSAAGVRHVNLGRRHKWDVHRLGGLARLLRRERFDILHAHKFGSNIWGTLIGRACRVPVVIAHEHSWAYDKPARAWIDGHLIARLADRFIAVSAADGRRMVEIEHIDADKVTVIGNGYIPSAVVSETDIRAELGLGLGAEALVTAAAAVLRPEKRTDLLLEAHAQVRAALPQAHLVIAGDGVCRPELERLTAELSLEGSVHFLGMREDVDSILRAADVGALTSDREGSPLFMFECMAAGTPLVATAVGGIPEVIENGRNGVVVPPGDPGAFADALIGLLSDPARRATIAASARESLGAHTIDAVAIRFADLYDTLTAQARR
jgi:glycosyltransferase involved in cell wall biosynthesis